MQTVTDEVMEAVQSLLRLLTGKSMWCRQRLRMFPALVNCCTIDWFREWPAEALASVATSFFQVTHLHSPAIPAVPITVFISMGVLYLPAWVISFVVTLSQLIPAANHGTSRLIIGIGSCCAACTLYQTLAWRTGLCSALSITPGDALLCHVHDSKSRPC